MRFSLQTITLASLGLVAIGVVSGCKTAAPVEQWGQSYTQIIDADLEPVQDVQIRVTDRISSNTVLEIEGYRAVGGSAFRTTTRLPEGWAEVGGLAEHARSIGADLVLAKETELGTSMVPRTEVGIPPSAAPQGGVGPGRTGITQTYEPMTLYEYIAWFYRSE